MKMSGICRHSIVLSFLLMFLASCETTIYLVRHGERITTGRDPVLLPTGEARAQILAELMANKKINEVLTTDSNRTRQTAQPTASRYNLPLTIYGKDTIPGFVAGLKNKWGKNILIVSHSETIPLIVQEFGHTLQGPITGFNRLIIIKRKKGNPVEMSYQETTYGN